MLARDGQTERYQPPVEQGYAEELRETRDVLGWLEEAFAWFLVAGDLQQAQALYNVIGAFSVSRMDAALVILQEVQSVVARQMGQGGG